MSLHELSVDECLRLLRSHQSKVGRVGFAADGLMTILPVNYRVIRGEVVFRTNTGSLLSTAVMQGSVAFEVDEVDTKWREGWSVLVRGKAREIIDPDENDFAAAVVHSWAQREAYAVAITPTKITGRRIT
ncbi:MAG TPA: pyridoxamine 5'-phosphate oxidase family protein [Euzebya sp.]|nr:pyridoxamine 5'-phosphate oxidase family protein [Euzebya sp.]